MLSKVWVILLDLPASAVLEADPQEISSFAVSRNYSHPSHPVPKDQVQLLPPPLPAGFLLLPQLPFHKLWRCLTPSPALHPGKHHGHSSRHSKAHSNHPTKQGWLLQPKTNTTRSQLGLGSQRWPSGSAHPLYPFFTQFLPNFNRGFFKVPWRILVTVNIFVTVISLPVSTPFSTELQGSVTFQGCLQGRQTAYLSFIFSYFHLFMILYYLIL